MFANNGPQSSPRGIRYANQNFPYANLNKTFGNFQLLEERIRDIEGFLTYGMDAKDLCLVPNVVLPRKFKASEFQKYKGLSCLKNHLPMYCMNMASYIDNDNLLICCFQDNLSEHLWIGI